MACPNVVQQAKDKTHLIYQGFLERMTGIEPAFSAWEASDCGLPTGL